MVKFSAPSAPKIFFEKDQMLGEGVGQKVRFLSKNRIFILKKNQFRINQPANAGLYFESPKRSENIFSL